MTKPFDTLFVELEKALKMGESKYRGAERYLQGIDVIREKIGKFRAQGAKFIQNGAHETEFFKDIWPAFYGKLFLYIRLYKLELRRGFMPADAWLAVIGGEEKRVEDFFRHNLEFWQYYRSGAPVIDEQFTRAYTRSRIFEPLVMVLDPDAATLASYRAAWCLAMQGYSEWLKEERDISAIGTVSAADLGYSWGASDADLAEWLFGIQAVGAVQFQGQAADISRLQKWARLAVGKEVANIYDRSRLLRRRKKERLVFTKKTSAALEKKWDQADGKFE